MRPLSFLPGRTSFAEARLLYFNNPEAPQQVEAPQQERKDKLNLPVDSADALQKSIADESSSQVAAAENVILNQQAQTDHLETDKAKLSARELPPVAEQLEGAAGDAGDQGAAGPDGMPQPAPPEKKGILDGVTRDFPDADKRKIEEHATKLIGDKRPVDMTQKQADLLMANVQMQTGATLKISNDKRSFEIIPPGSSLEMLMNRVMGAFAFASTLFAKETGQTLRETPEEYEARMRAAAQPDSPENRAKIDGLLADVKKEVAAMEVRLSQKPDDANVQKDLEEQRGRQAVLEKIIAERPALPPEKEDKKSDEAPQATETPAEPEKKDKSPDQIKLEAANTLAQSLNEAAGRELIRPDAQDWRMTVASIRGVLTNANAKAPATAALGIGMNGDALEEWDGGVFDIDNDIVSDFGTMLDSDPMQAVMRIMRMDPSFIRAENAKASGTLTKMQASLQKALPDIAKGVADQKAKYAAASANISEGTSAGSY